METDIAKREMDSKIKPRYTSIYTLPEEVLTEMLIRLPVKYILRCRCVQKSWNSLIKTPLFITLHLNRQKITTHNHPKYLFFRNYHINKLSVRLDDVKCREYCRVRHIIPDLHKLYVSYAVSYGLICASSVVHHGDAEGYNRRIYLWNPLVQKYKTLPDSPLPSRLHATADTWEALAFGFVPEVNDYVVVHIYKPQLHGDHHSVIIGVYSLTTNSWKKRSQDKCHMRGIRTNDAVFVNGAAFWLGFSSNYIHIAMCFDTKTEILREIVLPDWLNWSANRVIHPFGQTLAYFVDDHENRFDMGVLKGDPINEYSWEKKMSVGTRERVKPVVLGLRNNGEPILSHLAVRPNNERLPLEFHKLITYNLGNHEENEFVDLWIHWNEYSYTEKIVAPPFSFSPLVESLVFLDID